VVLAERRLTTLPPGRPAVHRWPEARGPGPGRRL